MVKFRLWQALISKGSASLVEIHPTVELASLDQAAAYQPDGAYTTLRTYVHDRALHLEYHFRRLEESARLAGQPVSLDRAGLRQALRLAVQAYPGEQELRLRILIELDVQPGVVWISAEALHLPSDAAYSHGVKTITCSYVRANPKAKLSATMTGAQALRQNLAPDVNEALMLDQAGCLLEGLSSNVFVVRDRLVWTAEAGVLSGITRQLVLDEARNAGIPLRMEAYPLLEISQAAEVFITSASRAVLPVRMVDDLPIGSGRPGEVTLLLSERYRRRLLKELEII